jgi:hypothetical protein
MSWCPPSLPRVSRDDQATPLAYDGILIEQAIVERSRRRRYPSCLPQLDHFEHAEREDR